MITKAKIVEIVSPYEFKLVIPRVNKTQQSAIFTDKDSLYIATATCLPNVQPNYAVDDIVFIGFQDNYKDRPVILGLLYRQRKSQALTDIKANSIQITSTAKLPKATSIGDVTPQNISSLKGCKYNISGRFQYLESQIGGSVSHNFIIDLTQQDVIPQTITVTDSSMLDKIKFAVKNNFTIYVQYVFQNSVHKSLVNHIQQQILYNSEQYMVLKYQFIDMTVNNGSVVSAVFPYYLLIPIS